MGYERVAIPLIGKLVDAYSADFPLSMSFPAQPVKWQETREKNNAQGIRGDSPNHRDMFVMLEVGRAAAWGTKADYTAAAAVAHRLLDLHLDSIGLWTSEQATGRPHGGMYLDAMTAGRIGALKAGDTALLARLDQRFRAEISYMVLTADSANNVLCCGERMPGGPDAAQQSAWLCETLGVPVTIPELVGAKAAKALADDAWVSLRGIRVLKAKGDKLGGARDLTIATAQLPLFARPISVYRWVGGHFATYLGKPERGVLGVCDWVWVDKGKVDYSLAWGKRPPGDVHTFIRIASSAAHPPQASSPESTD